MNYTQDILSQRFEQARDILLVQNERHNYNRDHLDIFPESAGVYAIFMNNVLIYIGETSNLKERMEDLRNTYNHTLRKKMGIDLFGGVTNPRKFSDEIELRLNLIFANIITISYLPINYGRVEIEEFLIHSNPNLYNILSHRRNS